MVEATPLAKLTRDFYQREWERRPSSGSRTGLVEYDDRLEVPTGDLIADELADLAATRQSVEACAEPAPGTWEWLDRQALLAHIDHEQLLLSQIQHWRTDPIEPVDTAIGSIFGLLMRRDVSLPETAEAIRKRLLAVPAYLEAARSTIDRPIRMWVMAARPSAQGGIDFFQQTLARLAEQHPRMETGLRQAVDSACQALEQYDGWLQRLESCTLSDDPAVGAEALEHIVRIGHGLPFSLEELDEFAGREMDRLKQEMTEVARRADPDRTWQQVFDEGRDEFASQPHELVREYREATLGLRQRLVDDGVLDMPPEEICEVISTPTFLREVIPSAAYASPGPLDEIQRGIFYVTEPAESLSPQEYRENLAQHYCFESTCGHEAYPGHHVQLCWANHAASLARQMAHHIIFMEGWTLYCEQLMVDLGYLPGPIWQLDCLHSQLWRACRIRIDVRVHTRRMCVREAMDMLKRELGFTEVRAHAELNWYTQSPGTPMSYLLGRQETMTLCELYRKKHPGSSLRDFHRWLLQFGSVPQRWLHAYI